jgi:hypothetical protein
VPDPNQSENVRFAEIDWKGLLRRSDVAAATPSRPSALPIGLRHFLAIDASLLDISTGVRQFLVAVGYPAAENPDAPLSGPRDILFERADEALALLVENFQTADVDMEDVVARLDALAFHAQNGLKAVRGPYPVLVFILAAYVTACGKPGFAKYSQGWGTS